MKNLNLNNYKIELVQQNEITSITHLLNSAYKELADKGLNYTAAFQHEDKTKNRISKGRCFVLKDSLNNILGTILLTEENYITNCKTLYIGQFGVLPELKKNGIGTLLMQHCENLARQEAYVGIQLDTAIPSQHLVDWYQRLGYHIIGKEHYEGKTYDSYIFEKRFSN